MSNTERSSKMMMLLKYRLRVTLSDSRTLIGQLLAFDKHMNIVLGECEEFRKIKIKGAREGERREREEKRSLGLLVLRGETIVKFTIESPPPQNKGNEKRGPGSAMAGSGIARPAGRGAPIAPVGLGGPMNPAAAAGLLGPPRIGGPVVPGMRGGLPMPPPPPPGWRTDVQMPLMPPPPMPGFTGPGGFQPHPHSVPGGIRPNVPMPPPPIPGYITPGSFDPHVPPGLPPGFPPRPPQ